MCMVSYLYTAWQIQVDQLLVPFAISQILQAFVCEPLTVW